MAQHFLLSAKARTLSIAEVARMSDDEAYSAFRAVRFAATGGEPACPRCGCTATYSLTIKRKTKAGAVSVPLSKCQACEHQFSVTSGTIFSGRKMAIRDILLAIALFLNGASGYPATRLCRDLRCDYKTALVLLHKLRELMAAMKPDRKLNRCVEIDGYHMGGSVKKPNERKDKEGNIKNKPLKGTWVDKKRELSIVTLRERRRGGRTLCFILPHESKAIDIIKEHVDKSASIRTDGAGWWTVLGAHFRKARYVNHNQRFSDGKGVHTNFVESFNSRLFHGGKAYRHMAGPYLQAYVDELAWREDHRRVGNGAQWGLLLGAAGKSRVSRQWKGYWQRRAPLPKPDPDPLNSQPETVLEEGELRLAA